MGNFKMLLKNLSSIVLQVHDELFRFRGFPAALLSNDPEEIKVLAAFPTGDKTKLKLLDAVEDNSSVALANVKGFSGSGLYQLDEDQIYVAGIVIEFQSAMPRFLANGLIPLNELLRDSELPELVFSNVTPKKVSTGLIDTGDFIAQCKQLLDDAEQHWKNLRPKQSLDIVRTVRRNINGASLSASLRNSLLSRVDYLEAFSAGDLREEIDVDDLFISADAQLPGVLAYQERAANAYINKGQPDKANELAEAILSNYPFNPHAWLVIAQSDPLRIIPETVQANSVYRVGYLTKIGKKSGDGTIRVGVLAELCQPLG